MLDCSSIFFFFDFPVCFLSFAEPSYIFSASKLAWTLAKMKEDGAVGG